MSATQSPRAEVVFLTVTAFKRALNISGDLRVKENATSGAYSVVTEDGRFFKAQKGYNTSKPSRFILEKGKDLSTACLINIDESKGGLKDHGVVTAS